MSKDMQQIVATRIGELGPKAKEHAIEVLIAKELEKRSTQIVAAFSEYDELSRRIRRFDKPDILSYDREGKEVGAAFSKSQLEERKKIQDRMDKIEVGLTNAVEKSDFQKLNDLGGPLKNDNKGNSEQNQ